MENLPTCCKNDVRVVTIVYTENHDLRSFKGDVARWRRRVHSIIFYIETFHILFFKIFQVFQDQDLLLWKLKDYFNIEF